MSTDNTFSWLLDSTFSLDDGDDACKCRHLSDDELSLLLDCITRMFPVNSACGSKTQDREVALKTN